MQSNRRRITEPTPIAIQSSPSTAASSPRRQKTRTLTEKDDNNDPKKEDSNDPSSAEFRSRHSRLCLVRTGRTSDGNHSPNRRFQFVRKPSVRDPSASRRTNCRTYTDGAHVWSANSNSIHPNVPSLPKTSKKKPARAKSRSSRSTTTNLAGLGDPIGEQERPGESGYRLPGRIDITAGDGALIYHQSIRIDRSHRPSFPLVSSLQISRWPG
jgi:hypothetical protein